VGAGSGGVVSPVDVVLKAGRHLRLPGAGEFQRAQSCPDIQRGSAAAYYEIIKPHAATLDIWQTEYLQLLEGEDAVYRWVSGTALRPFVQALDDAEREAFIAAYKAKLNTAYPRRADGTTLFPFQRLFVVATKA
jgi:trans-aconitate methyltransferase